MERETYQQLVSEHPFQAQPYSLPVFGAIAVRWRAWQHGIPPGREWRGYDGQNPRLMAAFLRLERAEQRALTYRRQQAQDRY